MDIVLATRNEHKLQECTAILAGSGVAVVGLAAFPDCPDVVEDGDTFAANALKKARSVAAHTGRMAVADDSGLEVDALGGRPGVYSARYAGPDADDDKNIEKLLDELSRVPTAERTARFRCVIALVFPEVGHRIVEGTCSGSITTAPRGANGFGYDPVFLDAGSGLTFAEMEAERKNRISHRARALGELQKILPAFLQECGKPMPS